VSVAAPSLPLPPPRVRARLAGDARPLVPPANAIVFWSNDAALVARRHDLRARIRAWEVSWQRSLILSPIDIRMQSAHDRWEACDVNGAAPLMMSLGLVTGGTS
jgi:hypothetical protein